MYYNNIVIFLIFCLTLSLIYASYIKFENKYSVQDKTKKKQIEDFYANDMIIKKYDSFANKDLENKQGFVNELIVQPKDVGNYLEVPIETEENITRPGEELIKKKETNISELDKLYQHNDKSNDIIVYETRKKLSTDLPIADLHINILLNNTDYNIKLSTLK
jgi:hypothetical protein